jgi:hypothetical protein
MKTKAIGVVRLDALMGSQSDAINSYLTSNSGHRESVNSIKVDHPKALMLLNIPEILSVTFFIVVSRPAIVAYIWVIRSENSNEFDLF